MYVHNLKKFLHGVNKKVYAQGIAITLNRVVEETVKDSGRAAANWNISFGSAPTDRSIDPAQYGQLYQGGRIGYQGDGGNPFIAVYKGFYYGYQPGPNGSATLVPRGRIYNAIQPGSRGAPKAAFIYNPIASGDYAQYAYNAFKMKLRSDGSFMSIYSDLAGYIPFIIHETAQELRFPITYK